MGHSLSLRPLFQSDLNLSTTSSWILFRLLNLDLPEHLNFILRIKSRHTLQLNSAVTSNEIQKDKFKVSIYFVKRLVQRSPVQEPVDGQDDGHVLSRKSNGVQNHDHSNKTWKKLESDLNYC
jgi:hypothetical protein